MQLICADWTGIGNFMKTFEKTWSAQYRDIEIVVHNFWNLERTGAEVYINGRRVYHNEAEMAYAPLHSLMGEYLEFEESGTKITVEIGSAWHFCGMACRISINGKYHAGNRIVWFAKNAGM